MNDNLHEKIQMKNAVGWVAEFSGNNLLPDLIINKFNGHTFAKVGTHKSVKS